MWRRGYERVPLRAMSLYDVEQNELLVTDHSSIDGFQFARRKTEGDDHFEETPTQNYSKTMTKYTVSLKATITWEMRKYDKYSEIRKKLEGLGQAASQRMELDLTHRFTFGTATSYTDMDGVSVSTTVGDGKALFDTAHTVLGSSTTFRNRVAGNPVFSKGGLEAAEKLFATQMINSDGVKIVVNPDTIVSTDDPATVNTILEFLKSTASPDTDNSGVTNVYQGKYRHVILPYLATDNQGAFDSDKEKYWMLMSVSHTDAILEISQQPTLIAPPRPGSNAEDFDNLDHKFASIAAWGVEITDPKFAVLSSGDGVA